MSISEGENPLIHEDSVNESPQKAQGEVSPPGSTLKSSATKSLKKMEKKTEKLVPGNIESSISINYKELHIHIIWHMH